MQIGKATKLPFKGTFTRAKVIGDSIHSDIMGPLDHSHPHGYRYAIIFQEDYSLYGFVGFMKRQSQQADVFSEFRKHFRNLTSCSTSKFSIPSGHCGQYSAELLKIKRLYSDNAKEYLCLERIGSTAQDMAKSFSPPYTPQLNGIDERINRTLCSAC